MRLNITLLALLSVAFSGYSQQITIPETRPLGIRSDADNSVLSVGVGSATTAGGANTLVGYQAGQNIASGTQSTFVGYQAGYSSSGAANTFVGYGAGKNNQSGGYNVFIGYLTGSSNTTGLGNLFLGQQAGANNTAGNYNLFIGNSSGSATTTGAGNTAIGDGTALQNTTGQRNTFIGQYAGFNSQSGTDNVFIGYAAKAGTVNPTNLTNAVAIGANAIVSQSNSIVLGNNASVGIGTSTPGAKLEIAGSAGNSGLRFTNLKSGNVPNVSTNQFLTVNQAGDVVLATVGPYNSGLRTGASLDSSSLWSSDGLNLRNSNSGGVVIGPGIMNTPAGYRLYVAEGVLTEKVKVAVKTTNDWSDRVFETGYGLRELGQVEAYIKANKHLPGVPSAEEMIKQGLDIAKMDAKLLEKIEELTLYSIQQQKEIEQLKKLVKQLLDKK